MSRAKTAAAALAMLLALLLTACAAAPAAPAEPELLLRYADNQPEDYPTTQAAYAFADLVYERTGGRVYIKVYANGELGDELSVLEQLQYGGIDFSRTSLGTMGQLMPSMNLLMLPYLYTDTAQMWRVLDGEIGNDYLILPRRVGLEGLSWFDAGARSFYTSRPVNSLADLSGLTLRVQESDLMSATIRALGGVPVQSAYSDVYAALSRGDIDGAENNWPSYAATNHNEVAPYYLLDEHTRIPEMQIASSAAMDKLAALDETFPDLVRACAREAALVERELWQQTEAEAEAALRAAGCIVTELSDEQRQAFRSAVAAVYDTYVTSHAEKRMVARIQSS